MKRILQILFTDLPYWWVRRLSLILVPVFIIVLALNATWILVNIWVYPWLVLVAFPLLMIVMILLSVFLAERMYRISYAEELRIKNG